ncbi:hypothetical protein RN001_012440 [Aquatica leii]|uniref:IkappaB kinase n=1 Tax=Aquatica leii TaxID=1421715 RepID=A0AAN7QEV7_9COLE|nr:hypothetical protein RN001_012440 [Aquatica leii]
MGEPLSLGDWKREKELGSGGFGVVHLWRNKTSGDCLAVKKCKWNLETHLTRKQQERWIQEVNIMKNIQNDNIVAYKELPEDLNKVLVDYSSMSLPVLPMEYCSLGNLRDVLVQAENCCGLKEIDVLFILEDISNALVYLHNLNITHRDVKPENIVLQYCDHRRKPVLYKLIDLGYAKDLHNETASFVGTLQYLAPEMFMQQKYTKKVDYWSFGVVAFEIICGVRPFLHTFTPWQSISYLEKKPSNVIALLLTHTGDVQSYTALLNENHINTCLAECLEKWLQTVLEYSPEKRGEDDSNVVYLSLQTILAKKIITVFSVYNYKFYAYEINESTLFTTLQGWIARDTKLLVKDQYLVTTKNSSSTYAHDYYDESYSGAMVFVFKKESAFKNNISTRLPTLIKVLFEDIKTEFKFGTLKQLFAQNLFLLLSESKSLETLKSAVCFQRRNLENEVNKGRDIYQHLNDALKGYLSEVEFYNFLETSLFVKVYEDTNYEHVKNYSKHYVDHMQKLNELIDDFNNIVARYKALISRFVYVKDSYDSIVNLLENSDLKIMIQEVCENICHTNIDDSITDFSNGLQVLKIVSKTIKNRDNLLNNSALCDYLRTVCACWKETDYLTTTLGRLQSNLGYIKDDLRKIQLNKINSLKDKPKDVSCDVSVYSTDEALQFNTTIRYRLQELMDVGILQHKNFVDEIKSQIVLE